MQQLKFEILKTIITRDDKCLVSSELKTLMADSLTEFVISASDKFIRGQQEHPGDIRLADLNKEMQQEQIDIFWYTNAEKWKRKMYDENNTSDNQGKA